MTNYFQELKHAIDEWQMRVVSDFAEEDITNEHLRDSKTFIKWTFLSYLPLWLFIAPFLSEPKNFIQSLLEISKNGEFALYSLSLLLGSYYIIQKEYTPFEELTKLKILFPKRTFVSNTFVAIAAVCILIAALSYFGDLVHTYLPEVDFLNIKFVQVTSVVIFLASLLLVYVVSMINKAMLIHKYNPNTPSGEEYYNQAKKASEAKVKLLVDFIDSSKSTK